MQILATDQYVDVLTKPISSQVSLSQGQTSSCGHINSFSIDDHIFEGNIRV